MELHVAAAYSFKVAYNHKGLRSISKEPAICQHCFAELHVCLHYSDTSNDTIDLSTVSSESAKSSSISSDCVLIFLKKNLQL